MNEKIIMLDMALIACVAGFAGYILGNMIGYSRGLSSACDIWKDSYGVMVGAFIKSVKKEEINKHKGE
jgi:hypothetical protein